VPAAPALERRLGLDSAAAIVVGEIIGVGIFLTPAEMARDLGSPLRLLLVWLAVGAASLCGALCYGALAARYPEAGGGYVYLREAWGPAVAFLYGWKSLLVIDPGLTAAFAAGLAKYLSFLAPLSPLGEKAVGMAAILVLAIVNALGAGLGAGLLRILTALKLGLLAVIVGWGFLSGRGSWANFTPFVEPRAGSAPLLAGLAGGVVAAFFCFAGFWDVAKVAGEVRDPRRTLPRALALGVGTVTVVYVLTSAAYVYLVPLDAAGSADAFAGRVGEALFGPLGGRIFAAVVVVAVLGSLSAVVMAAPRVYYAMARDGVFLRTVADVHPRFHTPVRAIAIQAALACLLLALGTFSQIVAYFFFVTVAFVALSVAGLYRLPRPGAGEYQVPGYPWTPAGFLILMAVMLFLLAAGSPRQAATGVAVVALGVPVYLMFAGRRPRADVPLASKEGS
jgi:basic amino acid/polyamine antiporter, APA family